MAGDRAMDDGRGTSGALHGVAAQRSRFHLAYRLAVRSYSVAETLRRGDRRAAATGAALSVATDLGIWAALRRTERLLLGPRLAVDVVDVAAWARQSDGPPEAATLPGVPLALEAGIRIGPAAVIVPIAHFAAMTVVRRRRGRPTPPTVLIWQVMGVGLGMWVARYEQHQRAATVALHARDLAARSAAARLAGQNAVAMGADTVVDEVARIEYLMAAMAPDDSSRDTVGTARALSEWKTSLAAATSEQAVYLSTLLARWQQANYGVALADDVVLRTSPGDGTTILSATQAAELERRLHALDLRGEIEVALADRSIAIIPGERLDLVIGEVTVSLAADPEPALRPFDPSPMVIVAGSVWCLGLASAGHGHVPWPVVLPAAAASGALAFWWDRVLRRAGPVDPERIVTAALGLALAQALVTTPGLRSLVDHQGVQVFPLLMTANAASALSGRYWRGLSTAAKLRVSGVGAAALAISLIVLDSPVDWVALGIQLVELGALFLAFDRLQRELDRDHDGLVEDITTGDRDTTEGAFDGGRRFVLDLVTDTTSSARRGLANLPADLDHDLVDEVHRRLAEAEHRLEDLHR